MILLTLSLLLTKDCIFFAFHMIIAFTLSLVKFLTFLTKYFTKFLFAGEYVNLTEKAFLSSNNDSGIIISSFPLSKIEIVLFINFNGDPALRYFCHVLFSSLLKSDGIRLARCSSPIALRLYLTGIFELQCTDNFVVLLKTCIVIPPFSLDNSVSMNFVKSSL